MADNQDDVKISQLDAVLSIDNDALFPLVQELNGEDTTLSATMATIAIKVVEGTTFANLKTSSKTVETAINQVVSNLAPDYDDTATYDRNDCVLYNGYIYQANQDISVAEEWDSTHWTQVNVVDLITYVISLITALSDAMIFKGTLGTGGTIASLPVDGSAKIGDTYKVITAGTYDSQAADVGDMFSCLTKTSSTNTWVLIPSGDEPDNLEDLTDTSISSKQTGDILKYNGIAWVNGPIWVEVTGTLTTGATSITLQDNAITTSSTIDVYTESGIAYTSVTVATGSVTITFPAQQSDEPVKVRIS